MSVGDRRYAGKEACQFVRECYDVRSDIVHGRPVPDLRPVGEGLDALVADLLVEVAQRTQPI